ncbi:TadE/TadG family type IV pilus assembly protein [Pseudoduganella violacea]|uniref:TadE-like domain-containing protein n=1 Tax=Pseudoduganella violacea TaxID=1715466 RepID=A0A7W5FRS8_9BURK|nr:TadE/TadG family type IV pilus assembly protein [Pseudoduganella violacea]MBB3117005.1 hypothetical protein [Pseudoduganella violacea]
MSAPRRKQGGVVAIELAIVLDLAVLLLLAVLLMGGRMMWHYTVLQRAAFDAARYMATMPRPELGNPLLAPTLAARASQLVLDAVGEAALDTRPGAGQISVRCDDLPCGGALPQRIGVTVQIQLSDPLFNLLGAGSITLSGSSVQPYVN